jgi:SAM-dependent methyltransferase
MRVITAQTLGHYNGKSEQFWQGTKDHDVTQNINALIDSLDFEGPLEILDLGCGPGRDLISFSKLGHNPTGLDGCEKFVSMAQENSSCNVLHQNFLELDLVKDSFHGVFANASLFHVPSQEFVRVLKELNASLKSGGVLFSSNPRGDSEGWNGDRWANYMQLEEYKGLLVEAGFELIDHYYRPDGIPESERPWLATISKKL